MKKEKELLKKKKWYKTWWGILMLILLSPVALPIFGIWWIWVKSRMNIKLKYLLTGMLAIFLIAVLASANPPSDINNLDTDISQGTEFSAEDIIYNIPPLVDKSVEEIIKTLGAPKSIDEPSTEQILMGIDEGSIYYEKEGQMLLITFNSKTRAIIDFFLEGTDENKLYAAGGLSKQNDKYITETVKEVNDSSRVMGLKASKRLPSELDGDVRHNAFGFEISNNENHNWTECRLKINDEYNYKATNPIKAKDKLVVNFSDFANRDGTRFNFLTKQVQNLFISCHTNLQSGRYNYFNNN